MLLKEDTKFPFRTDNRFDQEHMHYLKQYQLLS